VLLVTIRIETLDPVLLQGYLAHKEQPPPKGPAVGICLGPYEALGGGACTAAPRAHRLNDRSPQEYLGPPRALP